MGSILNDTKKALGLGEDYTPFDAELIIFINAGLADLNQLGVGPKAGFVIKDEKETWEQVLGDDPRLNSSQLYIHLNTRLIFDPPDSNVISAYEKMRDECMYRLSIKSHEEPEPEEPDEVDNDHRTEGTPVPL